MGRESIPWYALLPPHVFCYIAGCLCIVAGDTDFEAKQAGLKVDAELLMRARLEYDSEFSSANQGALPRALQRATGSLTSLVKGGTKADKGNVARETRKNTGAREGGRRKLGEASPLCIGCLHHVPSCVAASGGQKRKFQAKGKGFGKGGSTNSAHSCEWRACLCHQRLR